VKAAGVLERNCSNAPAYLKGPDLRPSHVKRKPSIDVKIPIFNAIVGSLAPSLRSWALRFRLPGRRQLTPDRGVLLAFISAGSLLANSGALSAQGRLSDCHSP